MKKVLLIMAVGILAMGCRGEDGLNGQDGSLNMRVAYYEIYEEDWQFYEGEGPDGLNRHYYYTIDRYMDPELDLYLNQYGFDDLIIQVEREVDPWVMVPLPNTTVIEELNGSTFEQHIETLTYEYSADPSQIIIHYFDSRFMDKWDYSPVDMTFRVVYMWP
jgi:hypothetical protein